MKYYFILGKNPILSKAEIEAVLNLQDIRFKITDFVNHILFIDLEKELDIGSLNKKLGGTVKIGLILGTINELEEISEHFFQFFQAEAGKAYYGFSLYPLSSQVHLGKYQKELLPIAMEIKRKLREEKNINSRYVTSKEKELSSVIVKKNKLLQNGAEICFFVNNDQIVFGKTLAVQEFEEFGARDFARPGRDDVSGMLPPKLARMMINLAEVKDDAIILDPFCGSGTILQEALFLGFKKMFGFDVSAKAIENTKNNLSWLVERYNLEIKNVSVKQIDVKKIIGEIKSPIIDAIITEPYLGPALSGRENRNEINKIVGELRKLYLDAFSQFSKILKPSGKIVIVMPIFRLGNGSADLDIFAEINDLGFEKNNKEQLIYSRENQRIYREICVFSKK